MDLLGLQLDLLLVLQVLVTALFVAIFSTVHAFRFPVHKRLSDLETATLVSLVVENHDEYKGNLDRLVGRPIVGLNDVVWADNTKRLERLLIEHHIDDEESYGKSDLTNSLGALVVAGPVSFALAFSVWHDLRRARMERLATTPLRRVNMAQVFSMIAISFGYLTAALWFHDMHPYLRVALGIFGTLGIFSGLALGASVVYEQQQWKVFYIQRLLEISITAAQKQDAHLVTQAMLARVEIQRAPTVPFPAAIGFYVTSFSVVQAVLLWIARNTPWL